MLVALEAAAAQAPEIRRLDRAQERRAPGDVVGELAQPLDVEHEQAAAVEWALTQIQATPVFGAYAAVALGAVTPLLRCRDAP